MTLPFETADLLLWILQILVIPAAVWVWRSFARVDKELEVVRARFANETAALRASLAAEAASLRERLSTAEARLKDVPSSDALHDLALSVERMSGNVKAMGERLAGVGAIVDRMDRVVSRQEEYLLNGGSK